MNAYKIIFIVLAILLLIPVLSKIMPTPLTMDRLEAGFKKSGLPFKEVKHVPPSMEAIDQLSLTLEGTTVDIYQYDDEGKIARYFEYQKPDPGQIIAEGMNIAASLGAAQTHKIPTDAARRGMFFIVVASEDAALRTKVIDLFKMS